MVIDLTNVDDCVFKGLVDKPEVITTLSVIQARLARQFPAVC